jgi:hypothetical protein
MGQFLWDSTRVLAEVTAELQQLTIEFKIGAPVLEATH